MSNRELYQTSSARLQALASGYIIPDQSRCVQCGICSFNCPGGIDVRHHAWLNKPVQDSACVTCGECVSRCPRGALHVGRSNIFGPG